MEAVSLPGPSVVAAGLASVASLESVDDFDALVELRSFFAQPEPLKWIAGVVKPFDMVPSAPHSGQKVGPWSLIPWTISVRWPHAEQR